MVFLIVYTMEYRKLGKCGLRVSEMCFGTMTFGKSVDLPLARQMIDRSLERGINFFDTADGYSKGISEEYLGNALKGKRRNTVVATKFFNPMGPGPNDSGMSRVHIMNAIDDSLKRLQMDYVDIYYVHHVDVDTPIEEMLRAMDDLIRSGKVRYIGCSNYQAWRLAEAMHISELKNLHSFVCYQPQYNLVVRDIEQELMPLCKSNELGVVTWGPLAGGFLSGKYLPGQREMEGTRSKENWVFPGKYFAPNADETLESLINIAKELNKDVAEVAIRWAMQRPGISSVIIGARTLGQLDKNFNALDWNLDEENMEKLNNISRLPDRYPESMECVMKERRANAVQYK